MEHLKALKATLAAGITAVSAFLGWKGIMALAWIIVMALDYLSGSAAAMKAGQWSSADARQGLWHKCGMILVVLVSGITDGVMAVLLGNIPAMGIEWPGALLPLVLAWYILTELGSILENAVKLGAAVPQWLVKFLKQSLSAVDNAGEITDENDSKGEEK